MAVGGEGVVDEVGEEKACLDKRMESDWIIGDKDWKSVKTI